jgi:hypothetical protein
LRFLTKKFGRIKILSTFAIPTDERPEGNEEKTGV